MPGMTGLAIMDVAGHSVGAAVCMASTRSILRCEAWARRSTREVIERVNDLVCLDLEDGGMYATLVYALYEHATGELRYTNAGHPAPLLLKAGEQRCRRLTMGGMGVGICARQGYREETARLTTGDVLILYTDGLTEARSPGGELFGETRLAQAVGKYRQTTAWEMVTALLGEVNAFAGGAAQTDDIALIVAKATSTTRPGARGPGR
jgi:phosphoserine phosphatase RsbU/P